MDDFMVLSFFLFLCPPGLYSSLGGHILSYRKFLGICSRKQQPPAKLVSIVRKEIHWELANRKRIYISLLMEIHAGTLMCTVVFAYVSPQQQI